jgi:hypothetical protein
MMIHWPSYLYIYPSWTDILAYYTDRITDVTGDDRPVHSTAQNPFQDIMVQREMCGKGRASQAVVGVRAVEGGSAATLHGGGIEGQDGEDEAVSESSLELLALEFKGS